MAAGLKVSLCVAALVVVCMAVGWPKAEGGVTCGSVTASLSQCLPYARGTGKLTPGCCAGVKQLNSQAATTADRKTACGCLKTIAKGLGNSVNWGAIASVPSQCGVSVPYKISPSTDCSQVH